MWKAKKTAVKCLFTRLVIEDKTFIFHLVIITSKTCNPKKSKAISKH